MSKWKRPSSVPIPTTWCTFEGKKSKKKYWIQDLTDEYKDEVIEYMLNQFMIDEPLGRFSNFSNKTYPKDFLALKQMWYNTLENNLALICLTKDDNGKPIIAAMNCTTICSVYDEKQVTEEGGKILQTLMFVKALVDPFKTLNITEYLDALGLYVLPEYRGDGLGFELLKAREPLSRACGIKASITLFSSIVSQTLAERAGFEDLVAIDYAEIERRNPKLKYPGIQSHTKSLRFMYILYK